MASLKVGLIGLGSGGRLLADALLTSSWCELVAVASRQAIRIEPFKEKHPEIATYNDFRSLIVSNPLDALFVAIPPFLRGKYLALAAERSRLSTGAVGLGLNEILAGVAADLLGVIFLRTNRPLDTPRHRLG